MDVVLKAAIITGACAIVAALITGAFTFARRTGGNNPTPAPTNHSPTQTGSPRQSRDSASPTPTTPKASTPQPKPSFSNVPVKVVKPRRQPGWTLDWNDRVSIQSQGIVVTRVGPQTGTGSNGDIDYLPGNGWSSGNNTLQMDNWPSTIHPGPSTIYGFMNNGGNTTRAGTAQVGEELEWINQNQNMIGYLFVTGVNPGGAEVGMWIWTKDGS